MDKETALVYARQYAEEVVKELNPKQIVMYGSYAGGHPHDDSDIDIAVVFDGFDGDFLQVSSWLWSLIWKVSSYIEPILLDKASDESGFVEEILKSGESVYQQ